MLRLGQFLAATGIFLLLSGAYLMVLAKGFEKDNIEFRQAYRRANWKTGGWLMRIGALFVVAAAPIFVIHLLA